MAEPSDFESAAWVGPGEGDRGPLSAALFDRYPSGLADDRSTPSDRRLAERVDSLDVLTRTPYIDLTEAASSYRPRSMSFYSGCGC